MIMLNLKGNDERNVTKVAKSSAEMLARYKVHINRLVPVCTTNFHLSFKLLTRCSPLLHMYV